MTIDAFHSPRSKRLDHGLRVAAFSGWLAVVGGCLFIALVSGAADGGWMDTLAAVLF